MLYFTIAISGQSSGLVVVPMSKTALLWLEELCCFARWPNNELESFFASLPNLLGIKGYVVVVGGGGGGVVVVK